MKVPGTPFFRKNMIQLSGVYAEFLNKVEKENSFKKKQILKFSKNFQ